MRGSAAATTISNTWAWHGYYCGEGNEARVAIEEERVASFAGDSNEERGKGKIPRGSAALVGAEG